MAKKYRQGYFKPKNDDKYVGTHPIIYRSSWELSFMRMCDEHTSVASWASESVKIPYHNPITNKYSMYVPDFIVMYEDKNGNKKVELVEVKPAKETLIEHAKSKRDKIQLAINMAKWAAADQWAKKHGMTFRVINEHHLFRNVKKRK